MQDDDKPITIYMPQFERPNDYPRPAVPPGGRQFFDELRTLAGATLRELGCRPWNNPADDDATPGEFGGGVLWLFPGEWYGSIPEEYELVSISGELEKFRLGETDDDIRHGCLAYGIVVKGERGD